MCSRNAVCSNSDINRAECEEGHISPKPFKKLKLKTFYKQIAIL